MQNKNVAHTMLYFALSRCLSTARCVMASAYDFIVKQESGAVEKKPRDAAAILLRLSEHA